MSPTARCTRRVIDSIKRGSLMATQTPELEGELLDEPVLRLTDARPLRQWPIFAGKLQAGELNGVEQRHHRRRSTTTPPTPTTRCWPMARSRKPAQRRAASRRSPIPCGAPLKDDGTCPTAADEDAFRKGRFARVVEPGVDLSVVLSEPVRVDPNDGHDYGAAIAALEGGGSFRWPVASRFA